MRPGAAALIAILATLTASAAAPLTSDFERDVRRVVTQHIKGMLSPDGIGGAGVAVRIQGRTISLNYGVGDRAGKRPIASDTLFNVASLRKIFETTVLAQAVLRGELKLDEPVANYVTELRQGGDIRRVTIGQLATHTSGLQLPQDHPPWPDWGYTLPDFINTLNTWKADTDHEPGKQHIYSHAGFILLALALERRFNMPIDELLEQRVLRPLGMTSTVLPRRDESPRGRLSPQQLRRAVQGYDGNGVPVGEPGNQQTYYRWPGTAQMYSSPRDMAIFLTASMGGLAIDPLLRKAIALAQQPVLPIGPRNQQALAWEIIKGDEPAIVEKYGGLDNTSAYIGMMSRRKIGVVILTNRANQFPNEVGRQILLHLAAP
jgi:beta-lactamase class C